MSRVFLSHSRFDSRQAVAVKQWLIEQESGLVDEAILCARLEPLPDANITSEWHHCDLFPDPHHCVGHQRWRGNGGSIIGSGSGGIPAGTRRPRLVLSAGENLGL
jgi:hypothetical protein